MKEKKKVGKNVSYPLPYIIFSIRRCKRHQCPTVVMMLCGLQVKWKKLN
jgi:hypothetical protein